MLGDLASRVLVLLLGYGYPAFESFKALEERPVEIRKLRFWCQYWTIVGIVTIFEWLTDFIISWLPMYGEAKLAFFMYLWHPKTRGTVMVYEAFLRPLVAKHEPDIEQKLRCFRAKSAYLILFYIKNFTEKGQSFFLDLLRYVISRPDGSAKEGECHKENINDMVFSYLPFIKGSPVYEASRVLAGPGKSSTRRKLNGQDRPAPLTRSQSDGGGPSAPPQPQTPILTSSVTPSTSPAPPPPAAGAVSRTERN